MKESTRTIAYLKTEIFFFCLLGLIYCKPRLKKKKITSRCGGKH